MYGRWFTFTALGLGEGNDMNFTHRGRARECWRRGREVRRGGRRRLLCVGRRCLEQDAPGRAAVRGGALSRRGPSDLRGMSDR